VTPLPASDRIGADRGCPAGEIDLGARAQRPHDGGVVDENVHTPEFVTGACHAQGEPAGIGDIGLDRHCRAAEFAYGRGAVGEFVVRARDQRDAHPGLGEFLCDRPPDAAAGAGHQRGAAVE
jgi:hypothetical protein